MYNLRRGIRNVLRSPLRTGVVTLLVGLGLALAIMSLSMSQALEQQVDQLAGEMGTELQIRPVGRFGGMGMGESTLTESTLADISQMSHVQSVEKVLTFMQRGEQSMVSLTGIESTESLNVYGGGTATLASGRFFTPEDQGQQVVIMSSASAETLALVPGDTYEILGHDFEVVGLFETEVMFGRMSTFVPLLTLQNLTEQPGIISEATVTVDRVENVQTLAGSIRELVGEEVDVVVPQERQLAGFESTLNSLGGSNSTNLVVALTVAGITIFFTMLLAVRERAREIGVLKALGATARDLVAGFAWEGLTLAVIGCIVGILLFGTVGQATASWFVDSALESTTPDMGRFPKMPGGQGGDFFGGPRGFDRLGAMFNPTSLITDNLQISLSPNIVGTIFAAALLLGTLGGVLPALFALRMKPAEVLRND